MRLGSDKLCLSNEIAKKEITKTWNFVQKYVLVSQQKKLLFFLYSIPFWHIVWNNQNVTF